MGPPNECPESDSFPFCRLGRRVALDFPELTIVAGHIGYPWTQEMIAVATKHANVVIDTSA
jgi:predicted TIM-barrel fold metal-dependent hydrolase